MKQSNLERRITKLVRPVVADKGYDLIQVSMQGQNLQIIAENPQTKKLGVDECAVLSREISTLLEVEDPIRGFYRLEVSSPGIDRPLVRLQDFADYEGFEAKIELDLPREGQKRFRGRIKGVEGNNIMIETDTGPVSLEFEAIGKAKLVMTDELLSKTAGLSSRVANEENDD